MDKFPDKDQLSLIRSRTKSFYSIRNDIVYNNPSWTTDKTEELYNALEEKGLIDHIVRNAPRMGRGSLDLEELSYLSSEFSQKVIKKIREINEQKELSTYIRLNIWLSEAEEYKKDLMEVVKEAIRLVLEATFT